MQRIPNTQSGRVRGGWLHPVQGADDLDELRAESMADEGGAAGALAETEEPPIEADDDLDEVIPEEDVTAREIPRRPKRPLFGALAFGTATAVSRLITRARIRFGRRAASRSK